ncbi:MAG: hypothetical protein ACMUHX_05180, partial [bacterium]
MQKLAKILFPLLLILFMIPHTTAAKEKNLTPIKESPSRRYTYTQAKKARSFYDMGVFAYEDGKYIEAENNLKEAIKLDP